jgi:hypothetical protein
VDEAGFERIASVVDVHNAQLYNAPLGVLVAASDRLDRLKVGEPDSMPQRKRA